MKRGTGDDMAPAAPPPPRSMGVLTCLPEVLVGHVCAFLPCRDIKRLRTTCTALRREPRCTPATITLARWPYEEDRDRRLAALTRLARHAAPVVKELRFGRAQLVEPSLVAVLAGAESLPSLTCLHLSLFGDNVYYHYSPVGITERVQVLLGEALAAGRLPALRDLQLHNSSGSLEGLKPVWEALGQGACPLLERLKLDATGSDEVGEAVLALRSRRDRGLPDLTALSLVVFSESEVSEDMDEDVTVDEWEDVAKATLLNCLSPASVLELELQLEYESCNWSPLLAAFLQRGCPVLRTLKITAYEMSGDALLHALADGAAPSLTDLALSGIDCSAVAWRAVAEAMGTDGLCLRRLKKLELEGAFNRSSKELEYFMRGVGEGHGCLDLHTLSLGGRGGAPCGAVVAQAFREPRGLPCLRHLKLSDLELSDLDQLVLSLQHRPHALQPVEKLDLDSHQNVSASSLVSLGKAMQEGRSLAGLKELLLHNSMDDKKDWESKLAEALASGAGRQLEVIDWRFPSHEYRPEYRRVQGMNCLLRSLAWRGACPVLKCLRVSKSCGTTIVHGLDMVALGVLLTGSAACSATLRSVELKPFELRKEDVAQLAIFLHHARVVELEALHLVVAADGAGFLSDALSALKGRAGRRVEELSVILFYRKVDKGQQVASLLVDVISSGGLPNLRSSDGASVSVSVRDYVRSTWFRVEGDALMQAVRNRAL